ncbi:MAG: RsmB/NOP family class I SAM-dependent RNA methyltransferase [Candidatus Aenigmarchaeota archaeon]|nr:RsmB/NOP family class I SAM-dependent RNA methyltransferase [Candidatus Aenigmarchaeota archaeon]
MTLNLERYEKIYPGFKEKFTEPFQHLWHLRVNTLKFSVEEAVRFFEEKGFEYEKIPWIEEGFWVKTQENLAKTIEHTLGYFFIQNASSMVPPLILEPKPGETILDLCAAPGAKTTQIAAMMENKGIIVANDITYKRIKALRGNLQRCGVANAIITMHFGERFWKLGLKFDKILLDAPCSGTGQLKERIFQQTSLTSIKALQNLQKKLIASASRCLKEKGVLVYSTCSIEPMENEEVVDFAVKNLGLRIEEIKIDFPFIKGLTEFEGKEFDKSLAKTLRIVPSQKTEGFFVCKLRK